MNRNQGIKTASKCPKYDFRNSGGVSLIAAWCIMLIPFFYLWLWEIGDAAEIAARVSSGQANDSGGPGGIFPTVADTPQLCFGYMPIFLPYLALVVATSICSLGQSKRSIVAACLICVVSLALCLGLICYPGWAVVLITWGRVGLALLSIELIGLALAAFGLQRVAAFPPTSIVARGA